MKLSNKPDDKENITAVNKFGPNASFIDSTWNRFEHVKIESDATELIVPPAQPTRWACIIKAGCISACPDDNKDNAIVLVMMGCIPMKENRVIIKGVSVKKDQAGNIDELIKIL